MVLRLSDTSRSAARAFDLKFRAPHLCEQGILEAGVETRDEAAGFLKDMGFSQEDADALATAVLAMRGWSKGGSALGEHPPPPQPPPLSSPPVHLVYSCF